MINVSGRRWARSLLILAACSGLNLAWASGSVSLGASGGASAAYHQGKALFHNKLACGGCPLAGKEGQAALDALAATELPDAERAAVAEFLKRRYRLQ